MSIERKCENCFLKDFFGDEETWTCKHCDTNNSKYDFFKPNEKSIRQDERKKFITLLKSDLENYDGLADEFYESNCVSHMDDMIECIAISKYIKSTIELLEKEQ